MRTALSILVLTLAGMALSVCPADRTFEMVAYTGVPMKPSGWRLMVVDLEGLDLSNKNRPILRDHSTKQIIGHTTKIVKECGVLKARGVLSGGGSELEDVIDYAGRDFPWQASIGFLALESDYIKEDETVNVNGRTFKGPLRVVRKSQLLEISVVVLGADDATETRINDHWFWDLL